MKLLKSVFTAILAVALSSLSMAQTNLNVTLQGHLPYPGQTCANICGYVDSLGNEYALVGAALGMSIVDVTIPTAPIEVKRVPGINNLWKEIKVYGKYAYVTTEGGGGLQIINMSSLPDTSGIVYHNYTGDGAIAGTLNTIHALHIDGHFAYLYGSNLFNGGAVAIDLTDPWNPVYAGNYQNSSSPYVHDGYVRNDTLYAGHIYDGFFSVVDFTNKSAPVELANQTTPGVFTHNTWLSTDSKTLFTTDEVNNSFLTAYDISDLANIKETDRIQSNPGSNSIVHNTHIIRVAGNDYAVTSWYKDGFTIVDAGRPNNLVQVGNYDTYPASGGGFEGTWGVYPFLPSGTIVVSNIEDGLYVFSPTYVRACYLEGFVTDSVTTLPINGATVDILTTTTSDHSKLSGDYATGVPSPGGVFSVKYSKAGYFPKTISGINLLPAVVFNQDVALSPIPTFALSGSVNELVGGTGIGNSNVTISNSDYNFQTTTDASGNFTFPALYPDTYTVIAGHWGYVTNCSSVTITPGSGALTVSLAKGYYDDFTFDFGWTTVNTASTGHWTRDVPLGTFNGSVAANPGMDDSTDCTDKAFVTGNTGVTASDDDVDNGYTHLFSPMFDLSTYTQPYLNYSRWFYAAGGTGTPNDSLTVYLKNGTTTATIELVNSASTGNSTWKNSSFKISDFITPTSTMQVKVRVADNSPGHLVEGGFDKFYISEGPTGVMEHSKSDDVMNVYPNPFTNEITVAYELKNKIAPGASIVITDITGRVVEKIIIDQQKGTIMLNPSVTVGVYFVKILNASEITSPVKIVKMK
jgi:choice-of-anchor B domain-containing protein